MSLATHKKQSLDSRANAKQCNKLELKRIFHSHTGLKAHCLQQLKLFCRLFKLHYGGPLPRTLYKLCQKIVNLYEKYFADKLLSNPFISSKFEMTCFYIFRTLTGDYRHSANVIITFLPMRDAKVLPTHGKLFWLVRRKNSAAVWPVETINKIIVYISRTCLRVQRRRVGKQTFHKFGPFSAISVHNQPKFGRKFFRPLYFLFGPFELCGRIFRQLATLATGLFLTIYSGHISG
jgi:hypothetical protein